MLNWIKKVFSGEKPAEKTETQSEDNSFEAILELMCSDSDPAYQRISALQTLFETGVDLEQENIILSKLKSASVAVRMDLLSALYYAKFSPKSENLVMFLENLIFNSSNFQEAKEALWIFSSGERQDILLRLSYVDGQKASELSDFVNT